MSAIIYKNFKYVKGFTLVEVIVVAVIVAVLATVAVPLYSNYVENAKKGVAENCAGSLASFISAGITVGGIKTKESGTDDYDGTDSKKNVIVSDPDNSNPSLKTEFIIPPEVECTIDWGEGLVSCKNTSSDYESKKYKFIVK